MDAYSIPRERNGRIKVESLSSTREHFRRPIYNFERFFTKQIRPLYLMTSSSVVLEFQKSYVLDYLWHEKPASSTTNQTVVVSTFSIDVSRIISSYLRCNRNNRIDFRLKLNKPLKYKRWKRLRVYASSRTH